MHLLSKVSPSFLGTAVVDDSSSTYHRSGGGIVGRRRVQQLGIAGPLILPRRCCTSPNGITPPRVIARECADIRVTMGARRFEVTQRACNRRSLLFSSFDWPLHLSRSLSFYKVSSSLKQVVSLAPEYGRKVCQMVMIEYLITSYSLIFLSYFKVRNKSLFYWRIWCVMLMIFIWILDSLTSFCKVTHFVIGECDV